MADEKQIEKIEHDIEHARKTAEEAGIIDDPDEIHFYESGDIKPELDDQTIAPPG